MSESTIAAVIALGPAAPSLLDSVQRFLGLVLTTGGNYPGTRLEHVRHDSLRQRLLIRVRGPRMELDRLAYALAATFALDATELEAGR